MTTVLGVVVADELGVVAADVELGVVDAADEVLDDELPEAEGGVEAFSDEL